MSWIVAILSVFLVIACLLLILLVLIQLPKKEAGMGQAFGGGTTDALFGAGSGTALTKMTKYTTAIFFGLTLLLWVLKAQEVKHSGSNLEETIKKLGKTEPSALPAPAAPAPAASAAATNTAPAANALITSSTGANTAPLVSAATTNAASKPATNTIQAEDPAKPK